MVKIIENKKINSPVFYDLLGANRKTRRIMIQEVIKTTQAAYNKYTSRFPDMKPVDIAHAIYQDERNKKYYEEESERMRILDAYPKLKDKLLKRGNYLWNTIMLAALFAYDEMYYKLYDVSFEDT